MPHDLDRMAQADAYNRWIVDRGRPWLRGRVLDVGAGIGTHTAGLAEAASSVVALEPDPQLAAVLGRNLDGVEVVVGEATDVEGPFDAVVCFNVLEHIEDDFSTLARFRELVAPNGHLLLLVPAHPRLFNSLDRAFGHERRYSTADLRAKLEGAGFTVVDLRYVNPTGAVGWFVNGSMLRREHLSKGGLALFNRLVPALRLLDRRRVPFGLSVWAIATPSA